MTNDSTRFHVGQMFTPGTGLIYTVRGLDPKAVYFCDSFRRHEKLTAISQFHPTLDADGIDMDLAELGFARFSPDGIAGYTKGEVSSGYDVFMRVALYLRRYFIGPDDVIDILATYVLLTYVYSVADTVPYLHLVGEPATGKSLVGDLLESLCFNARLASNITSAAVYRLLHATSGTLLVDEQGAGDARWQAVLRAGYRRSGAVTICEGRRPVDRRCFGPKVLITNEPLRDAALASRTINLVFEKTATTAQPYSATAAAPEAAALCDMLHIFGLTYAKEIWDAYRTRKPIPGISHREEDLAALPLAVATIADCSAPSGWSLHERLVAFFVNAAKARAENYTTDGELPAIARAIIEFVANRDDTLGKAYVWGGHDDWYLVVDFTRFANRTGELGRTMSTRVMAERLRRHRLIVDRQVINVPPIAGGLSLKGQRIQKVAYRFDLTRAKAAAGGAP